MLSEYRILAKRSGLESYQYQVHEVYFNDNGKPIGYSSPSQIVAKSGEDLSQKLEKIKQATDKPILWYGKQFPNEFKENQA
jgi:hypothetical protein